jgi:hypothetical protein
MIMIEIMYSIRDFFTRSEKMGRVGCETMNGKDTKRWTHKTKYER